MATPPRVPTPRQIRNLRRKLGLTQQEFAGLFGFTSRTARSIICHWERGTRIMPPTAAALFWQLVRNHGDDNGT
jgi:DNA-binding transcriptional regulator YiaG